MECVVLRCRVSLEQWNTFADSVQDFGTIKGPFGAGECGQGGGGGGGGVPG